MEKTQRTTGIPTELYSLKGQTNLVPPSQF